MILFIPILLAALTTPSEMKPVLSTLAELRTAEAHRAFGSEFDIEATVVSLKTEDKLTFTVQDGRLGMTCWNHAPKTDGQIAPGDRVRIKGRLNPGEFYAIAADCSSLRILGHGPVPPPLHVTPEDLASGAFTHCRIRLEAIVSDILADELNGHRLLLILSCNGAIVYSLADKLACPDDVASLIGHRIEVTGIYSHVIGHRRQLQYAIRITSPNEIRQIDNAGANPFTVDDINATDILRPRDGQRASRRKAIGRVLTVWGGNKLLLRTDDGTVVRGELAIPHPPACGTRIALAGLPETDLYNPILTRAIWKHLQDLADEGTQCHSAIATSADSLFRTYGGQTVYDYSFLGRDVLVTGIVRGLPSPGGEKSLYLDDDGRILTIDAGKGLPDSESIGLGDTVRVRGTCVIETEKMGFNGTAPHITGLRIVLNNPADIQVIARPPWWTPRKLLAVIGALLMALAAACLWSVMLRRVAERRSRELLQAKLARVESDLRLRERTRLSVELHDSLSQNLTGAAMEVNAAKQLATDDADATLRHLNLASKTLKSCRNELRACLWDLQSDALESNDMNEAIRKALEPYVGDTALSIRFNVPRRLFTDNTTHVLMRIVRELVVNAIRHGHAHSIKIAGSRTDGRVLFSVRDDGDGFDTATAPGIAEGHFGLQGIRERLRLLGGELTVESRPHEGTRAMASFELPKTEGEKI